MSNENNGKVARPHIVTFDLHLSRFDLMMSAVKFVWAAINGSKCVVFDNVSCDRVFVDGDEVET